MKKSPYLHTLILMLFAATTAVGQVAKEVTEPVFKAGEQLSYKFKYGFFTGAEGELKVQDGEKVNGRPTYHIVAQGKTAGAFDVFYKVRNTYESVVDRETLRPYFYTENRKEGSWKHTDKVIFDHQTGKITANKGVFPSQGKVFDFVSAYYFARSIDVAKLKVGERFDIPYFLDDGIYKLNVTYMGKEQIKTGLGKFNCHKFNPSIIPGRIFKKNSKLYLWITDDGNRIPVKANVDLIVGSVTMELTGTKGLKYPLNSIN